VAFYKKWPAVLPAILFTSLLFISWDSIFTYYHIWGFNPDYVLGYTYAYLPLEEWLFFATTLYACVFIYECLNTYIKKDVLQSWYKYILLAFAITGIVAVIIQPAQLYSSLKMGGAAVLVLLMVFIIRPAWLSRFTLAFLVSLVPFFIMNSVLTGLFTPEPIVWYNPVHIFNIRLGTIPIEDIWYNLFMLLTVVGLYERFKQKNRWPRVFRVDFY